MTQVARIVAWCNTPLNLNVSRNVFVAATIARSSTDREFYFSQRFRQQIENCETCSSLQGTLPQATIRATCFKKKKIAKQVPCRQAKLPSVVNSADSAGFSLIKGTSDFNNNQMGRIHYAKMD